MSLENSHSTEENFVEKTSIKIKDRNAYIHGQNQS